MFSELQHFKENSHNYFRSSLDSLFPCSPVFSNSMSSDAGANPKRDENGIPGIHGDINVRFTSNYYCPYGHRKQSEHNDSLSSLNSDGLPTCRERLGFESFGDVKDLLKNEVSNNNGQENHWGKSKRSRTCCIGIFPPPISCIGKSGKPFVSFKSFRQDGRFILKEIMIPTHKLLHACRENGRLKLRIMQCDDDDDDDVIDEDEKEENVEENKNVQGCS
ncbi:hypothetical protein OROHE_000728 [Orobanche hederae]